MDGTGNLDDLASRFLAVRRVTEQLTRPLSAEEAVVQSMPDASPAKWHLAHTSWFFETFVLARATGYTPFDPAYGYLFNSYYEALGKRHARAERGLLVRPSLVEVLDYRAHVTDRVLASLEAGADDATQSLVELGLHHEQQHQELILTDLKHLFSCNPLWPAYRKAAPALPSQPAEHRFVEQASGVFALGHAGQGFAFDNESPRHRVFIEPFALGSRLVTNREYLEFVRDGAYVKSELWLSDGFRVARERGWSAPLYWLDAGAEQVFTLFGSAPLELDEPVCHVSYYEADAFARWAGARLPSEAEWELAASTQPVAGNLLESGRMHPSPAASLAKPGPSQLFGDGWEWTSSAYAPYPGYRAGPGALGEYNGKFMCNQFVLRGGSCVTPADHVRATYRNFFAPDARWQFSGIRLAKSLP